MKDENLLTLTDENGYEVKLEVLDIIEYSSKEYVVLFPVSYKSENVVVLELLEENGEENYLSVDNPAIVKKVFRLFKKRNKHLF